MDSTLHWMYSRPKRIVKSAAWGLTTPKKKKVPGWSFSKSSPVQQVAVTYPIRVSAASLGAVSWAQAETGDQARVSSCMSCPMAKLTRWCGQSGPSSRLASGVHPVSCGYAEAAHWAALPVVVAESLWRDLALQGAGEVGIHMGNQGLFTGPPLCTASSELGHPGTGQ